MEKERGRMQRQMAFQMSELEYRDCLARLVRAYDTKDPSQTIGDWVDSTEPDLRKRDRLKAALVISMRCNGSGVDPLKVKKLVCWKNEQGLPGDIEAELHRSAHGRQVP